MTRLSGPLHHQRVAAYGRDRRVARSLTRPRRGRRRSPSRPCRTDRGRRGDPAWDRRTGRARPRRELVRLGRARRRPSRSGLAARSHAASRRLTGPAPRPRPAAGGDGRAGLDHDAGQPRVGADHGVVADQGLAPAIAPGSTRRAPPLHALAQHALDHGGVGADHHAVVQTERSTRQSLPTEQRRAEMLWGATRAPDSQAALVDRGSRSRRGAATWSPGGRQAGPRRPPRSAPGSRCPSSSPRRGSRGRPRPTSWREDLPFNDTARPAGIRSTRSRSTT